MDTAWGWGAWTARRGSTEQVHAALVLRSDLDLDAVRAYVTERLAGSTPRPA